MNAHRFGWDAHVGKNESCKCQVVSSGFFAAGNWLKLDSAMLQAHHSSGAILNAVWDLYEAGSCRLWAKRALSLVACLYLMWKAGRVVGCLPVREPIFRCSHLSSTSGKFTHAAYAAYTAIDTHQWLN